MVFMGDRATLLETGRFVQQRGQDGESAVDAAFAAAIAGAGAPVQRTGAVDGSSTATAADEDTTDAVDAADSAESEARHRRAADAGDTASMSVLGALLLRRGDLDGAEKYLRAATADGDRAAANNLGVLL
ncbi:sel1 repeat family protein, partial [Streptomyces griseus]|nr:sel1 repeat family protein [Streptomyces griseus]